MIHCGSLKALLHLVSGLPSTALAGAHGSPSEPEAVTGCVVARRSSRRVRARPLASLHVLSALPADCPHNPAPFAPL